MHPDACHCPLMLSTIHSVYCRPPDQPGGTTSGHELWRSKTTGAPPGMRSRRDSVVVAGHLATSAGELWMMTVFRLMASFGAGPEGPDGPGVNTGAGSCSIWNACVAVHGPSVVGS